MRIVNVECYYYDGSEIKKTEQPAYIQNEKLYVGNKKVEYDMCDINYEIRDVNGTPTLIVANPMFKKIALQEFSEYLFKKTELYKQLEELKSLTLK
jgi:hypothetical protein